MTIPARDASFCADCPITEGLTVLSEMLERIAVRRTISSGDAK